MGSIAQVRLDEETQAALDSLVKDLGMSRSEVLREGIRLVKERTTAARSPRLIGAGEFDSGLTDLATNPKYMEGFGRKWRNGKWDW